MSNKELLKEIKLNEIESDRLLHIAKELRKEFFERNRKYHNLRVIEIGKTRWQIKSGGFDKNGIYYDIFKINKNGEKIKSRCTRPIIKKIYEKEIEEI